MGWRRGLCWQGCGGVRWAFVPSGGNRLATRREGPVEDPLLGIRLSQGLAQTRHIHTHTHTHIGWDCKESGGGVQTWDKDISCLIYKIWHHQSALSSSLINIPSQRSHTHMLVCVDIQRKSKLLSRVLSCISSDDHYMLALNNNVSHEYLIVYFPHSIVIPPTTVLVKG